MLVEIFIIIMIIVYFILYELTTMSLLGWQPSHVMDNTDTLYQGDHYWQQPVFFLGFCFFVFISLPICPSIWVTVDLFAIWLKFLKDHYYQVPSELWVKQLIKTQCLTLGEWYCPLDMDPKLVVWRQNSR